MTLRLLIRLALPVAAVATLSCDPYNPALPPVPYCCGTSSPTCPDGYHEMAVPGSSCATDCECWQNSGVGDAGMRADSGPFACNDDSSKEPNENTGQATATAIGATTSTVFNDMALCPGASDKDVFRMNIDTANTTIEVVVDYEVAGSPVDLQILGTNSAPIANGSAAGDRRVRAVATAPVAGTYYTSAQSSDGQDNNYTIRMMITRP